LHAAAYIVIVASEAVPTLQEPTLQIEAVTAAVDEVARIIRADGGDLLLTSADTRTDRIHLQLVLEDVTCEDCVLPPDMLQETIEHALRRRIGGEFELLVDDPRRATPAP
jgi:Fe-S cluster biogenesis protein NfuA